MRNCKREHKRVGERSIHVMYKQTYTYTHIPSHRHTQIRPCLYITNTTLVNKSKKVQKKIRLRWKCHARLHVWVRNNFAFCFSTIRLWVRPWLLQNIYPDNHTVTGSRRCLPWLCSAHTKERYVWADSQTLTDMRLHSKYYMTWDFTWSDMDIKAREISLCSNEYAIYISFSFPQREPVSFPFSYIIFSLRNTTAKIRFKMETIWF